MKMERIVLVGYGGHAKSVADCIERAGLYTIVGYTDIEKRESRYPYLGTDEVLPALFDEGIQYAAVCLGYLGRGCVRESLYVKLKKIGYKLPIIRDPSAIISQSASIGEGSFVGKGAIVNAEAKIGKMVIINTQALIEHECIVCDFAHIAVAAVLCGQVRVEKGAFVGANATVIQERAILEKAIVPAGAVIR